jgi:stage II sporulation protein P
MPTFRVQVQWFMILAAGQFVILALCACVLSVWRPHVQTSGKPVAAGVSNRVLVSMVQTQLNRPDSVPLVSEKQAVAVALQAMTGIEWGNPATLLAMTLPGGQPLVATASLSDSSEVPEAPEPTPIPEPVATPALPAAKQNLVFIYHTHNRESYYPLLRGTPNEGQAYDPKRNVTLVGLHLAQQLRAKGIGTVVSVKDYKGAIAAFDYNFSYRYSRKTVEAAMAANNQYQYIIDIHRDSERRANTTVRFRGQTYAQIYLIIGQKNANRALNIQLARSLSQQLDEVVPGLSKGVLVKHTGNAEYNQSMSPHSVLIEIGGVDNSLMECDRTADVLADVLARRIWGETAKEG